MTLIKRLRTLFTTQTPPPGPVVSPAPAITNTSVSWHQDNVLSLNNEFLVFSQPAPLPDWIADEEFLRDEGILFGLSDTRPDGKIAEIRAVFVQQSAPLEALSEQHTQKISELNLFISQRESQLLALRNQATDLRNSAPAPTNLLRIVVSLCLSIIMCVGTFHLVDITLQPAFPNRWIAVGVFLAGMFNLFGKLSFFYEPESRLSGRRIIEEVGLPLASSVFILIQALQSQSVGVAIGLFIFVFFVFLLSGKLLLSMLTALQNDILTLVANKELAVSKQQNLPVWASEIERLEQEVDAIRTQKWPVVTAMSRAEAELTQLNAHRDRLVNLFMSEFELARSLRDRLTEKQREAIFN